MTLPEPTAKQEREDSKIYPEAIYFARRVSGGGGQPVWKKLVPDGQPQILRPNASQTLYNHSPDGFQWGYGGSGPAQLALALLLDVTSDPIMAQVHHQEFKRQWVASWGEVWTITTSDILSWLRAEQKALMLDRLGRS